MNYPNLNNMIVHFISKHTTRALWKCETCYTTTIALGGMKAHKKSAHREDDVPIVRTDGTTTGDGVYIYGP
jgi:hypothetical protein